MFSFLKIGWNLAFNLIAISSFVTLLSTDARGDSPFMIYLDGSKKKALVRVEFPNDPYRRNWGADFRLAEET